MKKHFVPQTQEEIREREKIKIRRQAYAAAKFSKQRFHRSRNEPLPDVILPQQEDDGRPRHQAIKHQHLKIDLLAELQSLVILSNQNINLNTPQVEVQWMPLHYFDDTTFQTIFKNNQFDLYGLQQKVTNILFKKDGKQIQFEKISNAKPTARVLLKIKNLYKFVHGQISHYNQQKNKFNFISPKGNNLLMPRIYICFDIQPPYDYISRLHNAVLQRLYQASYLKVELFQQFSHYVCAMPVEHVSQINKNTRESIDSMVLIGKFKQQENNQLWDQVQQCFQRCMNGILLQRYRNQDGVIPTKLIRKKVIQPSVLQYGMLALQSSKGAKQIIVRNIYQIQKQQPKTLTQTFKLFCLQSFFTTNQVIHTIQQIKEQLNHLQMIQLFDIDIFRDSKQMKEPFRYDHFQGEQNKYITRTMANIRRTCLTTLKQLIQVNFKNIGGWFKLSQNNKELYQAGKLKKFFKMVSMMIQDNILYLSKRSFQNFANYIKKFIPKQIIFQSASKIKNIYHDGSVIDSADQSTCQSVKAKLPLFETDLMRLIEDNGFSLATAPKNFMNLVINLFQRVIDQLSKIPLLQQKCMVELFKKDNEKYVKSPHKVKRQENEQFDQNLWIREIFQDLKSQLLRAIKPGQQFINYLQPFIQVLKMKPDEYIKQMQKQDEQTPKQIQSIKEQINELKQKEQEMLNSMPKTIMVSFFKIHCDDVFKKLASKYHQTSLGLIALIGKKAKKLTKDLTDKFQQIKNKIRQNPKDIEKLTQIQNFMQITPIQLQRLQKQIDQSNGIFSILDQFKYKLSPQDLKRQNQVMINPKQILMLCQSRQNQLLKYKSEFEKQLKRDQQSFKQKMQSLSKTISQFHKYQKKDNHKEYAQHVQKINQTLAKSVQQSRLFNSRQVLFQKQVTDYGKLQQLQKDFDPYSKLWLTTDRWATNIDTWKYHPFETIDADACQRFVEQAVRNLNQTNRIFKQKNIMPIQKISQSVKAQVDEFRPKVPLLVALRSRGMCQRHWQLISQKIGYQIKPDEQFNFNKILQCGLLNHLEVCQQVGQKASKEFIIESNLNEMQEQWKDINFITMNYKKSFIISGFDDISNVLDQHIQNTQGMQFSPFKKFFQDRIINWNNQLKRMSDIMEEWVKLQVNWMYLQPIFQSQDISKQLPNQSKKFHKVNGYWNQKMNNVNNRPNVRQFCMQENLLEDLIQNNRQLDIIQKELNLYLQKKRQRFARFYFLSNSDLLQIVSQTKQPTAVQPHLKKVFQNVSEVEFDQTGNKTILAMYSAQRQRVKFVKAVDPKGKNVEDWMNQVQDQMCRSVKFQLYKGVQQYPNPNRNQWVISHPGQCVLNGSQVVWTKQVQQALQNGNIKNYFDKQQTQLNNLVQLVIMKLSRNQRTTVNSIIVIDVHAKDVVHSLYKNSISDKHQFQWISNLRYYLQNDNCYVKCVQTNFPYGYQYLGNTLRLVITALTDKCYMTLMGALRLNLGGAPAGPAGTGKTQTTKDLAKGLAKQCVVFNCSQSMDYQMVGKLFKGLASAGAWACFDQFNRINIEVLSVIAQQLLILFGQKAKGSPRIEFQGSDIRLLPTFSVFITMNPGYAGRTQLPDNLKALFRPVAMMIPDYAIIGQIMLYSFGFKRGRELAKKMVATFTLSSQQLSSQQHYDYGMRAVRSVINAAGLLKQQDNQMDQDRLLLRALRDVNVPKFLKQDIPLFQNIISDLFPGIIKPQNDYGKLFQALKNTCNIPNKQRYLQPIDSFMVKLIQLYQTIQVRHGLMIVGPTGGGKTSCYSTLAYALSSLEKQGYYKVITHIMNPKSIKMGQLYGMFNQATRQWTDGVLAFTVRMACNDRSSQKHWIMFDGPVDALWIQNMNTVLDDNKKLCLNSGQILTLTQHMTMMFQVQDLLVASPATVSRCGMVYMQPGSLGLKPLIHRWKNFIPPKCKQKKTFIPLIQKLLDNYLFLSVQFIRKNAKEYISTVDSNLVQSCLRIMDCYFNGYLDTQIKKVTAQEIDSLELNLQNIFIFSVIWSVGASCDQVCRHKFDIFLRELMKKHSSKIDIPKQKSIYQFMFNQKLKIFLPWNQLFKNYEIDQKLAYHQIIVPTVDSARNTFVIKMLIVNNFHVMLPGPTGTGKSVAAINLLTSGMGQIYQFIGMTLSSQTSANQTQDTIDSKLDKRKKGVYGAPIGKKYIIFVDDLNMPKKQQFGAQPPIQLLRQFLDHHGWYNRKDMHFIKLEDLILMTALGPPGGGKTQITPRIIRHFNQIAFTQLSDSTISHIFSTMLNSFFRRFTEQIRGILPELLRSVLQIFNKSKRQLLPTPKKSHYTFNLRDIYKVFQGVCNISSSSPKNVDNEMMVRLWYHESMRVFHDRLIDDEDRRIFKGFLHQRFQFMSVTQKQILNVDRILFGDFLSGKQIQPRNYVQITDLQKLLQIIYDYQSDLNQDGKFSGSGKKLLKLVLFLDACEHICRICRILRQPMGNALLLGVGGSGRQSLSRLSTFIANYDIFQIEVIKTYGMKNWRQDLKKFLMNAALNQKPSAFVFVDTQIINQEMLQDLNGVLNSGDVTGLYIDKQIQEISNICKQDCIKAGLQQNKMNIFNKYLQRVKNNVHLVIAMSPLGEVFSTRLRMFPSLVNCCTLDWFTEWPQQALLAVGKGQLLDFSQQFNLVDLVSQIVQQFKIIHKSVQQISIQYKNTLRRYNYVTPTSYLELLTVFKNVYKEKSNQLSFSINRLKSGLNKLIDANKEVGEMQIKLKKWQPELEQQSIQTENLMKIIEVQRKQAEETQKIVTEEEYQANKQAAEAEQLAKIAAQQVSQADKLLQQSLLAVNKLTQGHLTQLKHSLGSPTRPTQLVLAAVVILCSDIIIKDMKGEIIMKKIQGTLKRQQNYVQTARKYLLDDTKLLLSTLKTYKKEEINQTLIAKLKQKVKPDPQYTYQRAKTASLPIEVMYLWAEAMYKFNQIYLKTQPLRDKKAAVQQLRDQKMKLLKEKIQKLQAVKAKIQQLENDFRQCEEKKEKLMADIADCQIKLQRAKKLTGGLSDQKQRWSQQVKHLQSLQFFICGNSILSSGMISYSGAFTAVFRNQLFDIWKKKMVELNLLFIENTSLVNFLGKAVDIQQWNIAGLPKDDNSIQNGLIIFKSRRWPLMIDPQNQANKYIKIMGRQNHAQGIQVLKLSNRDLMKSLQACIQQGKWALIQNIGTDIDPSLEPILLQQIVKSANGKTLTLGQRTLLYNDSFRFFLTTTIPNPHYSPETFVKVTILNFAITQKGLEDQMLAELVALENPQLQQKKKDIVKKNAQDKKELAKIEDSILQSLSGTGGIQQLLSDETLINQLQNSKRFAAQINQRMKDSMITQEQIDKARQGYRSVAYRASLLFFCIVDLSGIDPMYQYSLQWFVKLFKMGVQNAVPAKQLQVRLVNLNNYFTGSLYQNICRSLFQKHKLLFSFLLAVKILFGNKQINPLQWRYLLAGATKDYTIQPNPTVYISENAWPDFYRQLCGMNQLAQLNGIYDHFMKKSDQFKIIFDSYNPQQQQMPQPWNQKLNSFQKLIILKALRADKVLPAVQNWISAKLGKDFIIPPVFDLSKCFKDSIITTPLIFVLSAGSDPVADFIKFANQMDGKKYESISLGQGQGAKAQKMIRQASQRGGWVLLQNCHLAKSWMGDLEKIVQQLNDGLHKDFRLWLTSMPTDAFPISVLQNGVKMTVQPPQGLRANLLRSYMNISEEQLRNCKKQTQFKKLLFGFCFFHAIIQDRRKFGPIGWNIPYQFTNQDLSVCKRQLKMLLDQYQQVPYKVLNYLGAEINYGGRVTDNKDSRLIKTIMKTYINSSILSAEYKFSPSGIYYSPPPFQHIDYINYIQSLPLNPSPQVFGLHDNAEITNAQNQTLNLLSSILSIQPRQVSGQGKSRQQIISELALFIQGKTPPQFNMQQVGKQYPTDYNQSMNTVLVQQVLRYNRLLKVMQQSLQNLKKAIKGLVVMSQELQTLGNQLFDNQVPKLWADKGFLSLKPLASWIQDLKQRVQFLKSWIDNGTPKVFWISGFFFPQAFITGTLQNFARRAIIAIDKISFDYIVLDDMTYKDITQKPQKGCFIYGMHLQGCKWSQREHRLTESTPKELFSDMPLMHLVPIPVFLFNQDRVQPQSGIYKCPLYKVVSRAGTLSTTGHSTNFVMFLQLPSIQQQDVWIKAGVAGFLGLRY